MRNRCRLSSACAYLFIAVCFIAPAAAAPAVVVAKQPNLTCPQAELGNEELQARYNGMWEKYSADLEKARKRLEEELANQKAAATNAGNLNLVLFWTDLATKLTRDHELRWDEASLRKTWKQQMGNDPFPVDFTVVARKTSAAYAAAVEQLEDSYTKLVTDLTKAEMLQQALAIRNEIQGLLAEKPSAVQAVPQPPKPAVPPAPKRKEINLLTGLNVATGRLEGKWTLMPNGHLVGTGPTGEGIPRFNFANQDALALAQGDYDLLMEFSMKPAAGGFCDVIPVLPNVPAVPCFRNQKDGQAAKVFFFGGAETVLPSRFQPNRKYAAVIAVRNKGTRVTISLDQKQVLQINNFANKEPPTEFNVTVSPGSELILSQYIVAEPAPTPNGERR